MPQLIRIVPLLLATLALAPAARAGYVTESGKRLWQLPDGRRIADAAVLPARTADEKRIAAECARQYKRINPLTYGNKATRLIVENDPSTAIVPIEPISTAGAHVLANISAWRVKHPNLGFCQNLELSALSLRNELFDSGRLALEFMKRKLAVATDKNRAVYLREAQRCLEAWRRNPIVGAQSKTPMPELASFAKLLAAQPKAPAAATKGKGAKDTAKAAAKKIKGATAAKATEAA